VTRTSPTDPPGQPDDEAPVRVAVVFASSIMRRGCVEILGETPGIEVVFADRHDALDGLRVEDVDVTIVGLMPGTGTESRTVARLAGQGHRVLAVIPPAMSGAGALAVGAHGFVVGSDISGEDLVRGVRALLAAAETSGVEDDLLGRLSQREGEVLEQVATGSTDREIGERLGISMRTVQSHLDRIREKTGRRRRAELTSLAFELGLVRHDG
jgi:DNA-binding NarL/FixJ family response regulator